MSGTPTPHPRKFTVYSSGYKDAARAILAKCPPDNVALSTDEQNAVEGLLSAAGFNYLPSRPRIILAHIGSMPTAQSGMGLIAYQQSLILKGRFTIGNLCVVPMARRQDLSIDLMKEAHEAILQIAERAKLPSVIIELEQGGMSTERFYGHFGYKTIGSGVTGDKRMELTLPNPKYTP